MFIAFAHLPPGLKKPGKRIKEKDSLAFNRNIVNNLEKFKCKI